QQLTTKQKKKLILLEYLLFASRRRHTRSKRDWSSDVCSSDLIRGVIPHSVPLEVSGECLVAGSPVLATSVAELSAVVGNVPQDPHASITLPLVEDEIALTLENHGVDPLQIGQRIVELLESVGAEHLLRQRTQTLSGGWVQRVATVAALAAHPQVVLADEPTSMLDGAGVASVMQVLTELVGT